MSETKLVKKFYIEHRWISDKVDLSIVYGTISKQNFNVKKQENIIGSTYDTRIRLDSSLLFDNFKDAVKEFIKISEKLRGDLADQIKEYEKREKLLKGILKEVNK